ncbi:expressed unknown protein [Seminavis robusta]|uniref:Uncharacterized protein n=1 Tax=Seminavis robusta TaxID=568900 RepID=A0A9N8EF04_9STRA|nr:expressed unknown protein [Seminavis robusta]|eukprot:Sro897_g217440.1 n/a (351) ;mRNA; f:7340-8392
MTLNKSPFVEPDRREEEVYSYVAAPDGEPVELVTPSAPYQDEMGAAIAASLATGQNQNGLTSDDALAEAAAAEAREQGVTLIRDHLDSYLDQNPDASYITWIATLHPENAEVTIDPRFMIPGNPWATVFAEAQAAAWYGSSSTTGGTTVASVIEEHTVATNETQTPEQLREQRPSKKQPTPATPTHYPAHGGLIPIILGFSLLLSATAVAMSLQLVSTVLYLFAAICANICYVLPRFRLCTAPLYILPGSLMILFRGLDLLLLVLDSILVEFLALLSYVLTTLFALSHSVGVFYHQMTRRLPHYVRWACRKPFDGCTTPPRASCKSWNGHVAAHSDGGEFRRVAQYEAEW